MKFNRRRVSAWIASILMTVCVIAGSVVPASAASTGYFKSYSTIATINNRGKCGSMQGMAVGSTYLYTVKIKTSNDKAFISKTNKNTGETTVLTDTSTGSTYINYIGHANDMDVCSVDGKSHLFVATMNTGSKSIVRFKVNGAKITKVGNYTLKLNGEKVSASGIEILKKTSSTITLLIKRGCTFYTGTIGINATSGTINLTKAFTIDVANVTINGKVKDLSTYIHQGYSYYKGKIFVPLTGPDGKKNVSVVAVYDIDGASGTIRSDANLSFRITSSTYADLFEIESCGISSDGKLYFNTNRRKIAGDGGYDAIHAFKDYTF